MLCLSRKPGEVIHIGEFIKLVITKVNGQIVGVGIDAPKEIPIRRGELPQSMAPSSRRLSQGSGDREVARPQAGTPFEKTPPRAA